MDTVVFDASGEELGIIGAQHLCTISTCPNLLSKSTGFVLKFHYSEKVWKLIREMVRFSDNEVREIKVDVDEYKIKSNVIIVIGTLSDEVAVLNK